MSRFHFIQNLTVLATLCLYAISTNAQRVNQEWLTDTFEDDLKVGTRVCVSTKYHCTTKFGEIIKGKEKETTIKFYDKHGFCTQNGEITYKNTYGMFYKLNH